MDKREKNQKEVKFEYLENASPRIFQKQYPAEPSLTHGSSIPKLNFGDLNPDQVPVFGYPFVNYSPPMQDGQTATDCSDRLWQVFSKSVVFHANCTVAAGDKMLLAEMIDQRENNMDKNEAV